MEAHKLLKDFLELAIQEGLAGSASRLHFYLKSFYKGIPLSQKSVLDIGCGTGLLSLYAFCQGARQVVGLEPEAQGSTIGTLHKFTKMINILGLNGITALPCTFQEYSCPDNSYDIIVLCDSINHLDEEACIHLQHSQLARDKYKWLFSKMNRLLAYDGKIIITDCSRHNFFALLGRKNPFGPDIEWHKHQSPRFWANLLESCGFTNPMINWTTPLILRGLGKPLGNLFTSYFLLSHFRLVMNKKHLQSAGYHI